MNEQTDDDREDPGGCERGDDAHRLVLLQEQLEHDQRDRGDHHSIHEERDGVFQVEGDHVAAFRVEDAIDRIVWSRALARHRLPAWAHSLLEIPVVGMLDGVLRTRDGLLEHESSFRGTVP